MRYHLALAGLNCQRCVKKVSTALAERNDISHYDVTKTTLDVDGTITEHELSMIIRSLGFEIPSSSLSSSSVVPEPVTRSFSLSGLSCGRCISKVKTAFDGQDDVTNLHITKNSLSLLTTLSTAQVIKKVAELGFEAQEQLSAPLHETVIEVHQQASQDASQEMVQSSRTTNNPTFQLLINNMSCASCVASVEKAINQQPCVSKASVSLAEHSASVQCSDIQHVLDALDSAGYPSQVIQSEQERRDTLTRQTERKYRGHMRDTMIALGLSAPMMAYGLLGGSMMITTSALQLGWGIAGLFTLIMLATAGRDFFRHAWIALTHRRATMDSLVALGTGSAWLYSMIVVIWPNLFPLQARHVYFEASAMIIGLISLGHAIETRAKRKSSQALEKLIDLQPPKATVIKEGEEHPTPLNDITAGMILRAKPGETIALDGTVITGTSYIDESLLTGEPVPVSKGINDPLHAGTINQQGSIDYQVTATGEETLLAKIIDMVRQAQNSKPALANLVDKVAAVFVPVVVAIAILTAMIWWWLGPEPKISYMLVTATTVLIIACPCALGLATPMSVNIGVGRAAELGILVRDASALQLTNDINTIVVDKTGTLTQGKPALTHVVCVSEDNTLTEPVILNAVASIESYSEHPLAKALVSTKREKYPVTRFESLGGKGVSAYVSLSTSETQTEKWIIGNATLMADNAINLSHLQHTSEQLAQQGATPIFVAKSNKLVAMLGVSDPLREDSIEAVKRFQALGKTVVMLTGDNIHTANAIAQQVGISDVIANVLPDEKAGVIETLMQEGKNVVMIGDGINDAPALAAANVSMAMGSGSDVAKESAHFILIRHSLNAAVDAMQLSQATLKNMYQNLVGAFIYNTIGIPVAAGVLYPITGTLLNPMIAGAAMALSSITVVSNANRLRLYKTKS